MRVLLTPLTLYPSPSRERGKRLGASAPSLHWQVMRNAVEYAVLLHTGLLRESPEGGMRMSVSRFMAGVVILVLGLWGTGVLGATTNAVGKPLPADAAPPEQQVITGLT